jgi:hypothetical protein
MKRIIGMAAAVMLVSAFWGCKKANSEGESLDDKIKQSQTVSASGMTETRESLEADLKKWGEEAPSKEETYSAVSPSDDYEADTAAPYGAQLQTMQGILRGIGKRLNQYYALYRIYPSGTGESVWDAIKTKNPSDERFYYELSCADSSCQLTATLTAGGPLIRPEDAQPGGAWPILLYRLQDGAPDAEGAVLLAQYKADKTADEPFVKLDDFVAHEEICISLGGRMGEFGCVLKEKMGPNVKKDLCSGWGGEMKDGECVLKDEGFL